MSGGLKLLRFLIEKQRLYTIAFQENIESVQMIHKELKKYLKIPLDAISVYDSTYLSEDKKRMLNDLRANNPTTTFMM